MNDKRENSGPTPADAAAPSTGSTTSAQAGSGQSLRKRAEELARTMSPTTLSAQTPEEIQRVFHELQVHQIELEMQNEELRAAQVQIEAGRARYFDLYDMAPVGYCTLSEKGLILEANLTAATLLGTARGALVKQSLSRFILKEDHDIYYRHRKQLFETGEPQECDLRLVRPDGARFWAHLWATVTQAEDGAPVCRMVLSDITERKQAAEALQNSEQYLRTILQTTADGFWVTNTAGEFLDINEAYCAMSGYAREEILRLHISDIDALEDPADTAARIERVLENGVEVFETRHRRKDGSIFDAEVSVTCLDSAAGKLICFCRDSTARKQAEEQKEITLAALHESEAKLREAQTIAQMGHWELDLATNHLQWSDTIYEIFEIEHTQFGASYEAFLAAIHPDDRDMVNQRYRAALEEYLPYEIEHRLLMQDGRIKWVHEVCRTEYNAQGEAIRSLGVVQDITARKQTEEENRRFRIISDNAVYGKAIADLHGNLLYVNRFFADIHGYEPEELIGKHLSLFHSREQMEVTARINAAMMQAGHYPPTEVWHLHRDGTEFPMLMSGIVIKDDYGNPQYIAASAIDIAAQLQAEEALHTTIYELKKSQEVAKVGNWVWHVSQNRVEWSDEMYRIFGIDKELFTGDLAQIVNDCIHPEDRAEVHRSNTSVMEQNSPIPVEYRIIRPDGSVRTVWAEAGELELDGAGKPMLLRGIVHDITERKVAEEMLREREAHYRALAHENASLLHEVNHRVGNNMALLLALLDWTIDELTAPVARQALEHFRGRVESMAEVHRLLNKTQWAPIDLCTLIPSIIRGVLATATTRHAVQYDVVCSDKAIYIPAKPAFKTALVLNELATNSLKYAFTHTNGGKLTVRVALDDPWIELVFADDGPGWPAAVLAGRTDGMGLSLLRAIIEMEMMGTIALSNDHGAVVRLRFRAESEGSVNPKSGALAVP